MRIIFLSLGVLAISSIWNFGHQAIASSGQELKQLPTKEVIAQNPTSVLSQGSNRSPAEVFIPHLQKIQNSLLHDWVMRLPADIPLQATLEFADKQAYAQVVSTVAPPTLTIHLFTCKEANPSCAIGSIAVEHQASYPAQQAFQHHQAASTPIILSGSIQGYLLEGQDQIPTQPLSSVMWKQDGLFYTAKFAARERRILLQMAHSMANGDPIRSTTVLADRPPVNVRVPNNKPSGGIESDPIVPKQNRPQPPVNPKPIASPPSSVKGQDSPAPSDLQNISEVPSGVPNPNQPPKSLPETDRHNSANDTESLNELGKIGILPTPPDLHFLFRSSISSNGGANFFGESTNNLVFANQLFLFATPKLSPKTNLLGSVGGSTVRFIGDNVGFDLLRGGLGVRQQLTPNIYGQLDGTHRRLYNEGSGSQAAIENVIRLAIRRRDVLQPRLRLESDYELSARFIDSFANGSASTRLANVIRAGLRHDVTDTLEVGLDYRAILDVFTDRSRVDLRHQLSGIATYRFNSQIFVRGSVSYLFGPFIDVFGNDRNLNNLSIGVNLGVNIP